MPTIKTKPLPSISVKDILRFWKKVDIRGPEECWPWLAATDKDGYGTFSLDDSKQRAIRVGYAIHYKEDPHPYLVLHSCDNPPCCNPLHWRKGTPKDNNNDRDERGRTIKGERHWAAQHPIEAGHRLNDAVRRNGTQVKGDRHWARTTPEKLKRGSENGWAKLNEEQVIEIRRLYATGMYSQQEIADTFHVSQVCVSLIVRGKWWRHV